MGSNHVLRASRSHRRRIGQIAVDYTMPVDSRVQYAGIPVASFGNAGNFIQGYTAIVASVTTRCRQHGYIRQVVAKVAALTGTVKFKVFRLAGANYDFVSESETIALSATGDVTFNLTTPMACQPGDIIGCYLEGASAAIASAALGAGANTRYVLGDITGSNAFSSSSAATMDILGNGTSPYLAVTGDSIGAGFNQWQSFYDSGPAGTLANEPWAQLRALKGTTFEYQNHCNGSETFAWVVTTGFPGAEDTGAKAILVHCGVNDVAGARVWAAVESDLDDIKTLFDASTTATKLLIAEILPWTAGSDAQAATIRTWNGNLATWCAANGATLVVAHDEMGQVRISTGELDDLLAAYNDDNVHLTTAGYGKLAEIVGRYI